MQSTQPTPSIFDDTDLIASATPSYPSLKQLWILLFVFLGTYFVAIFGMAIYAEAFGKDFLSVQRCLGPFNVSLFLLVTAYTYQQKKKQEPDYRFSFRMPKASIMLILTFVAPASTIVFSGIGAWFRADAWTTIMAPHDEYYPDDAIIPVLCSFLLAGLEQILNRGILLDGLLKRYRPSIAILNLVLYAAIFYLDPILVPYYIIYNLLSSWVYYHTRSLLPCLWTGFLFIVFSRLAHGASWEHYLSQGDIIVTSIALAVLVIGVVILQNILPQTNKQIT